MKKKSKHATFFALVALLIMISTTPAFASLDALTLLSPYGEREVLFTQFTADGAAFMPLASYNVYADKGDAQRSSGLWYAWGWTRLVDKSSGNDIRHYTNVTYSDRYGDSWIESGRKWGTGKVENHTTDTYKHTVVRVWYGT